jgi:hypothetical protein
MVAPHGRLGGWVEGLKRFLDGALAGSPFFTFIILFGLTWLAIGLYQIRKRE